MINELIINAEYLKPMLVGFIAEEVRKVGFERVVLGLSGGVDSALSAALATEALGGENVWGIVMPYKESNPESLVHAELVARHLGINLRVIDITPMVDAYFSLEPEADKVRRGNKMSRERMTILYDQSAKVRALVLGTSNKTELLLGYGTLFGDMASALNPLGDLYKTQVWQLSRYMGLPETVVSKRPSADLWVGQTDEEELGFSYEKVDEVLYYLLDERYDPSDLEALGYEGEFVRRVLTLVQSSQYKRRLPLIAKVSLRTIDRDFRYPRDWGR